MKNIAGLTLVCGTVVLIPLPTHAKRAVVTAVCGAIGVQVGPMTAAFANSLGMTEIYGAILKQPTPGGPAAAAGIEAGDVVTTINGSPLSNWRDFAPAISMMAPGTTVYLNTWRDGQLMPVSVTLGSAPCPATPANPRRPRASRSS
jgi:serine protease Do